MLNASFVIIGRSNYMEGVMCKFSLFCFTDNCKDLLLHSDVLIPSDCPELPRLIACKMKHHSIHMKH